MPEPRKRYRGFISYSRKDGRWGRKIHKALEAYRIPPGVELGELRKELGPKRTLGRFFRDDDELAGEASLGAAIEGALDDSETLIVICSPRAAGSRWVNKEVVHFKARSDPRRVLSVIIDGEPHAAERGHVDRECFPLALRRVVSPDGAVTDTVDEPLAPDLTKEPFVKVMARLVAGILQVPFDQLWRRQQRIRRTRLLYGAMAAVALLGVIAAISIQLVLEQRAARIVDRDARLQAVASTLGSANSGVAFEDMRQLLLGWPDDAAVNEMSDAVLAWVKTPGESVAAMQGPVLYTDGHDLFLKSLNGTAAAIGPPNPLRRIGFKDGRVVLIYPDRVVLVDVASSRILDQLDEESGAYAWDGLAFQAPDGTAVIAGHHLGISNSQHWHALLSFSARKETLSIKAPFEHPDARDPWQSRDIKEIRLSADCRTIGVASTAPTDAQHADSQVRFLLRLDGGIQFAGKGLVAGGKAVQILPATADDFVFRIFARRALETQGCTFPSFDTLASHDLTGVDGLILVSDSSHSPAGFREWSTIDPVPPDYEHGFLAGSWSNRPQARLVAPPCAQFPSADEPKCRYADRVGTAPKQTLNPGEQDLPGWVASSMPPEGVLEGKYAEQFEADPLLTYHAQYNAAMESAWCRRFGGRDLNCVGYWEWLEFHGQWSTVDLRSRSGRFIFYTLGRLKPFEIFDVVAMRVVTPKTARVVVRQGAAAFSGRSDDMLFVAAGPQLYVFVPNSDVGPFEEISSRLSWNRQLGGNVQGEAVVGLIAPSNDELIAVRENGRMTRLAWRTGIATWTRSVSGIGVVRVVRRSAKGDYFVVVGTEGMRLVRSRDGLLLSGVLVPPYLLEQGADRSGCASEGDVLSEITEVLSDVSVEEGPRVVVRCGLKRFAWQPRRYQGDKLARLAAVRPIPARGSEDKR